MSAQTTALVLDLILGLLTRAQTLSLRLQEAHSGGAPITEADVDAMVADANVSRQQFLDAIKAGNP